MLRERIIIKGRKGFVNKYLTEAKDGQGIKTGIFGRSIGLV